MATKLIRDPFLAVSPPPGPGGGQARERAGTPVRLRIRARRYASTGHNVIGHLPGRSTARIAVAAHYDTAAGVPGATAQRFRTSSSCASCRRRRPAARGIDFVAFGADEYRRYGGANLGAAEYVRRHPRRSARPAPWWRRTGSAPPPGARGCA